jgi:ribosome-associated translation inhibitor RaiA
MAKEQSAAGRRGGQVRRAAKRAALPAYHPKPEKRVGGRSLPSPAHVRVMGVDLSDADREYIRRKLGGKLAKFGTSIERVTVRMTDANGPRGGVDQVCQLKIVLIGLPSIIVERRHVRVQAAFDASLDAAVRSVRKAISRRRTKPITEGVRQVAD